MLNQRDIKALIKTVLKELNMYSYDALMLVFRTGLVESNYEHLRQKIGRGSRIGIARSFFQIEPWVARSIINDYIKYRKSIRRDLERVCMCDLSRMDDESENDFLALQLTGNIMFGIAMCRLKYRPVPKAIPKASDIIKQAGYWKKYYNTAGGKGTVKKFTKIVEEYERG